MHLNAPLGTHSTVRPPSSHRLNSSATSVPSSSVSLMPQPQYILSTAAHPQQSHHYDIESVMIEMIVRHLGNLNEDEVRCFFLFI